MKAFVIFGDIEFTDARGKVALVHRVHQSGFYEDADIADTAEQYGGDYLVPHYFDGEIIFAKYHKETDNA